MGLEAATYIHQLNPSNPVGAVDPKSQGDDHIRMIKATLQATFATINGPVTVTLANLNQWAGLSGNYNWSGQHRGIDGTAGAPAFSFVNDTNTGMYRNGADDIGFACNGVASLRVTAAYVLAAVQNQGNTGSVGAPQYSFAADTDTGIWLSSTGVMQLAAGGANALTILDPGATGMPLRVVTGQLGAADGSVSAPAYSFVNDPNTGIYSNTADQIGFSAGGVVRFNISTSNLVVRVVTLGPDGTAGAPAYSFESDSNTGIYRTGTDTVGLVGGGTVGFQVDGTGAYLSDGNASSPGIKFNSDTNTGFYRIAADQIGFAEGGTGFRIGFRSLPRSTTATTLVAEDVGKCVAISAAINIPASVFSAGDVIDLYNDSAAGVNVTISAGTLRLAGTGSAGTRNLAARGKAQLWFNTGGATPEVIMSGDGVS